MASRNWRWLVGIGLAIPTLPVLAFLVLFQLDPERTIALAFALLEPLIANTGPPAMFADQLTAPRGADRDETGRQLTARLQHEFPVGTTEATLKKALEAQGFKPVTTPQNCVQPVQKGQPLRTGRPVTVCPPQDQRKTMKYGWGRGVCGETIWIRWSIDANNVITLLDGYYNATCL